MQKGNENQKQDLKRLALIMLLLFLVSLLVSGCSLKAKRPDKPTYIELKRNAKIDCLKEFIEYDLMPSEARSNCEYVFKRRGDK